MDFKETKAYPLIKEFILLINNSIKNEKQIPIDKDHILFKIRHIIISTPLSEKKGRYANLAMVNVIEEIGRLTETMPNSCYLKNAFGNKIRMDFGTGHELNFLCFLFGCYTDTKNKVEEALKNSLQTVGDSTINDNFSIKTDSIYEEGKVMDKDPFIKETEVSGRKQNNSILCDGIRQVDGPDNLNLLTETGTSGLNSPTDLNQLIAEDNSKETKPQIQQKEKITNESKTGTYTITSINQISEIFKEYFSIVRLYIKKYNIEAAGSRGCWSIDDYLLLPYLFGSAENFNEMKPIDCIGKGMFREAYNDNQSMMLSNLCKLSWPSINVGIYKMYVEEVLGRFVVVQHFIYSDVLPKS